MEKGGGPHCLARRGPATRKKNDNQNECTQCMMFTIQWLGMAVSSYRALPLESSRQCWDKMCTGFKMDANAARPPTINCICRGAAGTALSRHREAPVARNKAHAVPITSAPGSAKATSKIIPANSNARHELDHVNAEPTTCGC